MANFFYENMYFSIYDRYHIYHYGFEDKLGMSVTSGSTTLKKDVNNLIGISIGGGAPICPCVYIVQVFDNTATSRDGTLQAGDELIAINGQSVKGKTKTEVAQMIQIANDEVTINYKKLHADPKQGKTLDIVLKKVKHRLVEKLSSSTADALGLSRAILCNDSLVKKLKELQDTELMYKELVDNSKRVVQYFKAYGEVLQATKSMGDVFATIAVREPQPTASETFRVFAEQHRNMERMGLNMLKTVKPVLSDLGTYLHKAIPDTRLTVKKYADAKFEYLAYCLKVKEMDDEECNSAALQEPLYRIETGNYEYRLILRCRQLARVKFAKMRADVLIKMDLLNNKHVQTLSDHLTRLVKGLADYHTKILEFINGPPLFPIEVDLSNNAFQYKSINPNLTESQEETSTETNEQPAEAEIAVEVSTTKSENDEPILTLLSSSNYSPFNEEQNEEPDVTSDTTKSNFEHLEFF